MMKRAAFILTVTGIIIFAAALWRMQAVEAESVAKTTPTLSICEGATIAYTSEDGLRLVRADGSGGSIIPNTESLDIRDTRPDLSQFLYVLRTNQPPNGVSDHIGTVSPDGVFNPRASKPQIFGGAFSPDGTKIVFAAETLFADQSFHHIYLVTAQGETNLTFDWDPQNIDHYYSPSFSPDGSRIVFVGVPNEPGEPAQIFTINTDGTGFIQLTDNETHHLAPRFNADGTLIYFIGEAASNTDLYAMSSLGSIPARLTFGDNVFRYRFSPDANRIAYESLGGNGNFEVFAINSDGSGRLNITNHPGSDRAPIFSSDGSRIVFSSNRESTDPLISRLHVVNLTGGSISPALSAGNISAVPVAFIAPDTDQDGILDGCDNCRTVSNPDQADNDQDGIGNACDPDDDNDGVPDEADNCALVSNADQLDTDGDALGNSCDADDDNDGIFDAADNCPLTVNSELILFESSRVGNLDIYSVNKNGTGAQTNLTNSTGNDTSPSYSRAANKIAFSTTRHGSGGEIYLMNPDGTGLTRLTNNTVSDAQPNFSRDGSKIVFTSNRDGNTEIYVMNADGSGQIRLTNTPPTIFGVAFSHRPEFSPDGSRIVFASDRASNANDGRNEEIYIMNANGSGVVRLTNNLRRDTTPSFSPDGSRIVFQSTRDGFNVFEIYIMSPDGSVPLRLTETGDNNNPSFSPDGSLIAFNSTRDNATDQIFVMNADGSNETRLFQSTFAEGGASFLPQIDADNDGVGDVCDNCRSVFNPNQTDADNDGTGDNCDISFDVNTPAGTAVPVEAPNATINFSNVTVAGTTSFTPITIAPADLPQGFALCPTCPAFEITTTAEYEPPVTVCLQAPAQISMQEFLTLRLMHGEDGIFVDRTTGRITRSDGARFVCGTVDSLSPFALAFNLAPTAAQVTVGGRVLTESGVGVRNASVSLTAPDGATRTAQTNSFGYYRFETVPVGETYLISVSSKRFTFSRSTIVRAVFEEIGDLDFIAFDQ